MVVHFDQDKPAFSEKAGLLNRKQFHYLYTKALDADGMAVHDESGYANDENGEEKGSGVFFLP